MNQRSNYPINDAIDDLEKFFRKNISSSDELQKFLVYLEKSKSENRLAFRFVHEELMKYRKKNSDYFLFSDEERKMIDDLLYFWG